MATLLGRRLLYTAEVLSPQMGFQLDAELPALVLASVATDGDAVVDYLRTLHRLAPGIPIILYGPPSASLVAAQAMNAGARYFLVTPVTEDALYEALDAVRQTLAGMAALAEMQSATARRGRLITVFSPKGGSGATTLAVNMGAAFSQQGFRTIIVDGNLGFGNVGIFFGETPEKTISDAIPVGSGTAGTIIDPADLARAVLHHASGVDLLLAPLRPEEGERITKDHVDQVITLLQRSYARIIADTWTSYDDRMIQLLDRSDVVIVPICPELPAVRNLGALARVLKAIQLPMQKFRWVLVRSNTVPDADIEDLQRFLSLTIHHRIVSDGRLVLDSMQQGIPFVVSHPQARVAQDVVEVCTAVNEQLGEPAPIPRASGAPAAQARGAHRSFASVAGRGWQAMVRRLQGSGEPPAPTPPPP
ncbi:MAG: response regulator [Chloroflexota bacterium]